MVRPNTNRTDDTTNTIAYNRAYLMLSSNMDGPPVEVRTYIICRSEKLVHSFASSLAVRGGSVALVFWPLVMSLLN